MWSKAAFTTLVIFDEHLSVTNTYHEMGIFYFYKNWPLCWCSYRLPPNVAQFKVIISVSLLIISKLDVPINRSYLTTRFNISPYIDRSVWPSIQSWERCWNDKANICQWLQSTNKPAVERVWKLFSWFLVLFVCFRHNSPQWTRASSFKRFLDHRRRTTVSRTPLNELLARRRDPDSTQHSQ
jgi:hypothetical protein